MASLIDRWEKDPFFSVAEEIQESADRLESIFRRWIQTDKDTEGVEFRRDLQTALGTTKWQLEEFEKATRTSYNANSADDEKNRHKEFIVAIESNISRIETSLNETTTSNGKPPLSWVRLDEGERDELAVFLSGAPIQVEKTSTKFHVIGEQPNSDNSQETNGTVPNTNTRHSVQLNSSEEKQLSGHRRTASANADIGSVKISVSGNGDNAVHEGGHGHGLPPKKVGSFSRTGNSMESSSSFNRSKNNGGYRKLKSGIPLSQQLKKSKDGGDDCDKHVYGWYGGIKRLMQRSQYQVQYCRPIQIIIWSVLLLCLIILLILTVIFGLPYNV